MKVLTLIVSILIVIAVLIPGPRLPDVQIGGYDKLIHMVMFAAWSVAVRHDFNRSPFPHRMAFGAGLLFSLLTELLQLIVEGRSFDIFDMAADAAGLIVGLFIGGPIVRWMKKFTG